MNWKSLSKLVLRVNVCKKAKFAYFYKFYSLWTLCWKAKSSLERKILRFTHNPHTSHKFAQTLTLNSFSWSPKLNCVNEACGVENEVLYRHHRWRETQGSPNKWFITLSKHYSTFNLATINTLFQKPSLANG